MPSALVGLLEKADQNFNVQLFGCKTFDVQISFSDAGLDVKYSACPLSEIHFNPKSNIQEIFFPLSYPCNNADVFSKPRFPVFFACRAAAGLSVSEKIKFGRTTEKNRI